MLLLGLILLNASLYALARLTGTQVDFLGALVASVVYLAFSLL